MSTDILHCTWLPATHNLFIWGETAEPPRRKGRQPKLPPHPFQSAPAALRERLKQGGVQSGDLVEHTLTFWLPSIDKTPVPSPELLATGAVTAPAGVPTLAPWQVTGVLLPVSPAVDMLLTLPPTRTHGADLHVWRTAALLAMQMVA